MMLVLDTNVNSELMKVETNRAFHHRGVHVFMGGHQDNRRGRD